MPLGNCSPSFLFEISSHFTLEVKIMDYCHLPLFFHPNMLLPLSKKVKELCVTFFKTTINIVVIITINNRLFNTHTHACEFMTSKTSWHTKKYGIP
jgi:hypothetical protein